MAAFLAGIAASAINQGISSLANSYAEKRNLKNYEQQLHLNYAYQNRLASDNLVRAYEFQRWRDSYESPRNQISRLLAAGVNPYVTPGSIEAIGSSAGSAPAPNGVSSPSAPMMPLNAIGDYGFAGASESLASARKIDSETLPRDVIMSQAFANIKRTLSAADNDAASAAVAYYNLDFLRRTDSVRYKTLEAQLDAINESNRKLGVEIDKIIKESKAIDEDIKIKQQTQDLMVENILSASLDNSLKTFDVLYLKPAQLQQISVEIQNILADTSYKKKQTELLEKDIEWYDFKVISELALDVTDRVIKLIETFVGKKVAAKVAGLMSQSFNGGVNKGKAMSSGSIRK